MTKRKERNAVIANNNNTIPVAEYIMMLPANSIYIAAIATATVHMQYPIYRIQIKSSHVFVLILYVNYAMHGCFQLAFSLQRKITFLFLLNSMNKIAFYKYLISHAELLFCKRSMGKFLIEISLHIVSDRWISCISFFSSAIAMMKKT